MKRRRLALGLFAGVLVVAQVASVATSAAAVTLSPNSSMFFFQPGHAMTGTLKNGVFTRKHTFTANGWTAAAATRDSLALYNKNTGKLKLGTFRGGTFKAVQTKTLLTGYTRMAASCDTLWLYNGATGRALTATLKAGKLGQRTSYPTFEGIDVFMASCDSMYWENRSTYIGIGHLTGGKWDQVDAINSSENDAIWSATSDSYVEIDSHSGGRGQWGNFTDASLSGGGSTTSFGAWDIVAGSADSVFFYTKDGTSATATLKNGNYTYIGGHDFGVGWNIIVGGR